MNSESPTIELPYFPAPHLLAPALILGILAGDFLPGAGILSGLAMLVFAGLAVQRFFQKNNILLFLAILLFAWGYLSVQSVVNPRFPSHHIIHFADKYKRLIVGIIDEEPFIHKGCLKFILNAETVGSGSEPVTGKLRVTTPVENVSEELLNALSAGDRISFVSKIKTIRNYNNPGSFDYERYMAFRKIWAAAYISQGYRLDVLKKAEKSRLEKFRDQIAALIDETGPGEHVGVLKALIIGERSEISAHSRENFGQAGIAHLFAISGLHIDIVGGLSLIFLDWLFLRLLPLSWRLHSPKAAKILSLIPVISYAVVSGLSVPTQRAVIMFALSAAAFPWEKNNKYKGMNTLAVVALLLLMIHPAALFSVPFQLSFMGVFSILYGMSKVRYYQQGAIFSMFFVSLFAIFGTLPIVMFYYNQISLVGLFANFIFIPVIGFMVIPLGLFSAVFCLFSAEIAGVCIRISAFILANTLEIITPSWLEILGCYLLGGVLLHFFGFSEGDSDKTDEKPRANRKWAIGILVFVIFIGILDVRYWLYRRFWHDDLRVTVIDVGQGSSALLEFPGGACMLIDGGGLPDNSDFDVGERILAPVLLEKRIKTLDMVVLSHPDSDHLNGLLYIVRNFNVRDVRSTNEDAGEMSYYELMKILREKSVHHPKFEDMPRAFEISGVRVDVLYPPADFADKKEQDKWREKSNNNSLVVKVGFGEISFLFPGDIEAPAEKELVRLAGEKLRTTVLISPHHGSKTSSTDEFLDAADPEYVIISAGWNNQFRLPHSSVLERYRERGYEIFRTDENGAICILTDGKSLQIAPYVSAP